MERTKSKDKDSGKLRWKKTGGGSFRMGGNRIIKPGEVFSAYPEEIPEGFRDTVILQPGQKLPEEVMVEATKSEYECKKRETGNWYDVFDANGKQVNTKAMTRVKALELIAGLEG